MQSSCLFFWMCFLVSFPLGNQQKFTGSPQDFTSMIPACHNISRTMACPEKSCESWSFPVSSAHVMRLGQLHTTCHSGVPSSPAWKQCSKLKIQFSVFEYHETLDLQWLFLRCWVPLTCRLTTSNLYQGFISSWAPQALDKLGCHTRYSPEMLWRSCHPNIWGALLLLSSAAPESNTF